MPKVVSIVGKSGSGKTTLIERLIPELNRRGYRVGTIKHAFHAVDMDRRGKDSWRHRDAGAEVVVVASKDTVSMVKNQTDAGIDQLVRYFADMDLVITEGFKREAKDKIEVLRSARNESPLCLDDDKLAAFVTDVAVQVPPAIPVFGLDDIDKIAEFIIHRFIQSPRHAGSVTSMASTRQQT